MTTHRLIRIRPLKSKSDINDTKGYLPQIAKQELVFVNEDTADFFSITDLYIKQSKKKKKFLQFLNFYEKPFTSDIVSIIGVVLDYDDNRTAGYVIKEFKKKLRRLRIQILGYIGVRDIGDNKFQRHLHILVVVRKLTSEEFGKLKGRPKQNEALELQYHLKGSVGYLIKKNLYAPLKSRSYIFSKKFQLP